METLKILRELQKENKSLSPLLNELEIMDKRVKEDFKDLNEEQLRKVDKYYNEEAIYFDDNLDCFSEEELDIEFQNDEESFRLSHGSIAYEDSLNNYIAGNYREWDILDEVEQDYLSFIPAFASNVYEEARKNLSKRNEFLRYHDTYNQDIILKDLEKFAPKSYEFIRKKLAKEATRRR